MALLQELDINQLISLALKEDLGDRGDITSQAIFLGNHRSIAVIRAKETGVAAGTYLIEPLFLHIDTKLAIDLHCSDGDALQPGTPICTLTGPTRSILAGERVALNLLQRLSGVATATASLCALIRHTKARLLDTRKTTPLLRQLEKRAVLSGGGTNHRFGLFDMILIKDTHVKAAGGVVPAIKKAKIWRESSASVAIEVEVQTLEEFKEALSQKPDRIMLDNMDVGTMKECVDLVRGRNLEVELEASGNVSAATIAAIAETGVDFISVGALTHSVKSLDIHLVIVDTL